MQQPVNDQFPFLADDNEERQQQEQVCKSLSLKIGAIIFFLFNLVSFLVSLISEHGEKFSRLQNGLGAIIVNFDSQPLLDIEIKNIGENCQDGFKRELLGVWGGSMTGCYCKSYDMPKRRSCRNSGYERYCRNTTFYFSKDFYSWNSKEICTKRAEKDIDYIVSLDCPHDHIKCNHGFCFNKSVGCPITNIMINQNQRYFTNNNLSSQYQKQWSLPYDINNDLYIHLESNQNNKVAFGLKAQINGFPCFTQEGAQEGPTQYSLLEDQAIGCKKQYGIDYNNSFIIDNTSEFDMMVDNNYGYIVSSLPRYREYAEQRTYSLVGLRKYEVREYEACQQLNTELLSSAKSNMKFITIGLPIILGICLLLSVPSICVVFVNLQNIQEVIKIIPLFVIFVLDGIAMYYTRQCYYDLKQTKKDIDKIANLDCFYGDNSQVVFNDLSAIFKSPSRAELNWTTVTFILGSFAMIPPIFIYVKQFFRRLARRSQ